MLHSSNALFQKPDLPITGLHAEVESSVPEPSGLKGDTHRASWLQELRTPPPFLDTVKKVIPEDIQEEENEEEDEVVEEDENIQGHDHGEKEGSQKLPKADEPGRRGRSRRLLRHLRRGSRQRMGRSSGSSFSIGSFSFLPGSFNLKQVAPSPCVDEEAPSSSRLETSESSPEVSSMHTLVNPFEQAQTIRKRKRNIRHRKMNYSWTSNGRHSNSISATSSFSSLFRTPKTKRSVAGPRAEEKPAGMGVLHSNAHSVREWLNKHKLRKYVNVHLCLLS